MTLPLTHFEATCLRCLRPRVRREQHVFGTVPLEEPRCRVSAAPQLGRNRPNISAYAAGVSRTWSPAASHPLLIESAVARLVRSSRGAGEYAYDGAAHRLPGRRLMPSRIGVRLVFRALRACTCMDMRGTRTSGMVPGMPSTDPWRDRAARAESATRRCSGWRRCCAGSVPEYIRLTGTPKGELLDLIWSGLGHAENVACGSWPQVQGSLGLAVETGPARGVDLSWRA